MRKKLSLYTSYELTTGEENSFIEQSEMKYKTHTIETITEEMPAEKIVKLHNEKVAELERKLLA